MNKTATEVAAADSVNTGLTTFTAVLSLFGTLFIVVSFFVWKDIQSVSRRILVFISIADFFTAVANILGLWSHNERVCLVQSTIGTLSVLSSFFWTVFMAVFLYSAVCAKRTLRKESNLMYLFHLLGWGIPIIIVSIGASTGKLGDNGDMVSSGWCWVSINMSWKDQVLWMLLAGKGWEIAAYFIIAFLYYLIKRHMRRELNKGERLLSQSTEGQAQRAEWKLILIPVMFVLLRIWGTIRFFIIVSHGPNRSHGTPHTWLLILQGIGDTAQGFANFLLFCFFTEKVLGKFRSWCSFCMRWDLSKANSPVSQQHASLPSCYAETNRGHVAKQVEINESNDVLEAYSNVTVQ